MRMWGPATDDKFFGRVPMMTMVSIAMIFMVITQLFISIWYLSYHCWFYFITLAAIVAAGVALFFTIRAQDPNVLIFVICYQALFVILFLGAAINLIVLLCHPYSDSYLFRHCFNSGKETATHCATNVRIAGAVYSGIYLFFAVINGFCLMVLYRFYLFLKDKNNMMPRYTPNGAPHPQTTSSTPAASRRNRNPQDPVSSSNEGSFISTTSDPSANNHYPPYNNPPRAPNSLGSDWDNQPTFPPAFQQQKPYNAYEETVPTVPAYPPSNNAHLYDDPPY